MQKSVTVRNMLKRAKTLFFLSEFLILSQNQERDFLQAFLTRHTSFLTSTLFLLYGLFIYSASFRCYEILLSPLLSRTLIVFVIICYKQSWMSLFYGGFDSLYHVSDWFCYIEIPRLRIRTSATWSLSRHHYIYSLLNKSSLRARIYNDGTIATRSWTQILLGFTFWKPTLIYLLVRIVIYWTQYDVFQGYSWSIFDYNSID